MATTTHKQISAVVSTTTKEQMDRVTRTTGVKQNHLVEVALQHHLRALHELPADIVVPARLVVAKSSSKKVAARLTKPNKPTAKLRELMSPRDDD